EILAGQELQAVDEDAHRHGIGLAPRDAHQREMARVQVAHRRHEGDPACRLQLRPEVGNSRNDLHPARLKNSRRLFMARRRDTSSSKSASRSTKFRFSELTISTGAAL